MAGLETETILLVCDCEQSSADILRKLHKAGISVVGPAANASMAMAIAAQTPPTIAVVATPPNGRRNAAEFAGDLLRTWGVQSWILEGAALPESPAEISDADDPRIARLQAILYAEPTDPLSVAVPLPA